MTRNCKYRYFLFLFLQLYNLLPIMLEGGGSVDKVFSIRPQSLAAWFCISLELGHFLEFYSGKGFIALLMWDGCCPADDAIILGISSQNLTSYYTNRGLHTIPIQRVHMELRDTSIGLDLVILNLDTAIFSGTM